VVVVAFGWPVDHCHAKGEGQSSSARSIKPWPCISRQRGPPTGDRTGRTTATALPLLARSIRPMLAGSRGWLAGCLLPRAPRLLVSQQHMIVSPALPLSSLHQFAQVPVPCAGVRVEPHEGELAPATGGCFDSRSTFLSCRTDASGVADRYPEKGEARSRGREGWGKSRRGGLGGLAGPWMNRAGTQTRNAARAVMRLSWGAAGSVGGGGRDWPRRAGDDELVGASPQVSCRRASRCGLAEAKV
jgi:hypothetical protein